MAMLNFLNQVRSAINSLQVRTAEGPDFDAVVAYNGLPRILGIAVKRWRQAALRINYAKRDALGPQFSFVREALRGGDVEYTVFVGPSFGTQMVWVSGGETALGFGPEAQFRLWDIGGKIYASGAGDFGGDPYSAFVNLVQWKSPHWAPGTDFATNAEVVVKRLPFLLRTNGGVELVLEETGPVVPPTYMQTFFSAPYSSIGPSIWPFMYIPSEPWTAEDAGIATPANPLGSKPWSHGDWVGDVGPDGYGRAMTIDTLAVATTDVGSGLLTSAFTDGVDANLFFRSECDLADIPTSGTVQVGDRVFSYASRTAPFADAGFVLQDVALVSGEQGVVAPVTTVVQWDVPPARGGDYIVGLHVNGDDTAALEVTLGATAASASASGSVDLVSTDTFEIRVHPSTGTPPTLPLVNAIATVLPKRPDGEPKGGMLMGSPLTPAAFDGSPFPLYLGGSAAHAWQNMLENLVAAGVPVTARTSQGLNNQ